MIKLQKFLIRAFKDKPFSEFHVQFGDDTLIRVVHVTLQKGAVYLKYVYLNGYVPKRERVFTWTLNSRAAKYVVLGVSVKHTHDGLIAVVNVNNG